MGKATWQYSLFIEKAFNLYSQQDFAFRDSLLYARQFKKFEGAIVPNYCYFQSLTTRGQTYPVLHASLPVDVDVSQCHKFFWSARHGDHTLQVDQPDTLEVFAALTCIRRNPAQVAQGNLLCEEKVCDILFPGSWALALWQKYVCLWYKNTPILQRNPHLPKGLLLAEHANLAVVLSDYCHF